MTPNTNRESKKIDRVWIPYQQIMNVTQHKVIPECSLGLNEVSASL